MKRTRCLLALPALVIALSGCAHLDYMGESYAPTSHVDVYYSESNVPRDYAPMGEAIVTADMLVSGSKMQDKLRQEAMRRGADAIVLTSLETVHAGESSSWTETQTESKDKKGRTKTETEGSSTTTSEEKKRIRALFIRYKPASQVAPGTPDSTAR